MWQPIIAESDYVTPLKLIDMSAHHVRLRGTFEKQVTCRFNRSCWLKYNKCYLRVKIYPLRNKLLIKENEMTHPTMSA